MFARTRPHTAIDSVSAVTNRELRSPIQDDADASAIAVPASPSVDQTAELQRKIYDLVKTRVLQSIGSTANWTVTFRSSSDTDTLFSDTMADMIAWDVAHQLVAPTIPQRARITS